MELSTTANVANLQGNGTASQLVSSLKQASANNQPLTEEEMQQRHDMLAKNAQRLVAQTFYGAVLKQMRESPFKSKLFDGGRGGEAFSTMLDQHLADRMAAGSGNKLSRRIVDKIEHVPTTRRNNGTLKNAVTRHVFKHSPYAKKHAGMRRPHVKADFRA